VHRHRPGAVVDASPRTCFYGAPQEWCINGPVRRRQLSVRYSQIQNILHSSESKSEKSKLAVFKNRSQHTGVSTRF
jgi:hypothetical protein